METTPETASRLIRRSLNPNLLILRGILSLAFGILALLWPGPGLLAIALLFGAYAFADGVVAIATGVRQGRRHESWGLPVLEGIFGVAAGIITLFYPGITLYILSIFAGFWALLTGVLELAAAFRLENFFPQASRAGRVLLGIAGVLSIALGVAIFVIPALGAVTLLALVASYALIFGVLMIALGIQQRRGRQAPGQAPAARAA